MIEASSGNWPIPSPPHFGIFTLTSRRCLSPTREHSLSPGPWYSLGSFRSGHTESFDRQFLRFIPADQSGTVTDGFKGRAGRPNWMGRETPLGCSFRDAPPQATRVARANTLKRITAVSAAGGLAADWGVAPANRSALSSTWDQLPGTPHGRQITPPDKHSIQTLLLALARGKPIDA